MQSSKRTIILAGVLAAVLAVGLGRSVFMQPVRDAEGALADAQDDLEAAGEKDWELQNARKRVRDAMAVSLPPSLNDAQRLYLEWITDLTHECNFAQLSVQPGGRLPRSGKFLLVSVVIEAESSLNDLTRFLFQFRQADLMHRITDLNIISTGTTGKPRVEFTLTAEGMSVIGSDHKTELAARLQLSSPLDADATALTVSNADEFPSRVPFTAKLSEETIRVTAVDGNTWTIERGVDGSDAAEHAESTRLRHFPVAWDRRERRFDDYAPFLGESLFTKPPVPREYHPELAGVDNLTIEPGQTASLTARVDDFNVDIGEIEFSLSDAPEGMQIDEVTGQLNWETAEDQPPADHTVTVTATQQNNPELQLEQTVTITVRLPNDTPQLTLDDRFVVFLGRSFELTPSVTDDGDADDLSWTLEAEELPEGLEIDNDSGTILWDPPLTFAPGTHTVTITVTDQGDPPESASQSITLEVRDDDARFTRLTATVRKDGQPEAWFENSRSNSQEILHIGDELKVADIEATVTAIEARFVALRDDEGDWRLALGNNVRDRVLTQEPDKAEAADESAAPTDEPVDSAP